MGIKDDQYQLCPAPNTKIADASLKCQTTCEEMENKVKAEVKDGLNHYQRNFGSRSSSSALPGKSETYDHYLNPQQYRQVTESVSRYYALLARDLETIAWPKVAAVVSYQFGCNIDNFMEGGWSRNPFLGVGTPQQNDDVAVALGEGVTRIFKNLYPLVRMIADYGPAAFLACVDAGEIEAAPEMVQVAKLMLAEDYEAADRAIVKYEQRTIASALYEKFDKQYEYLEYAAQKTKIAFGWPDTKSVFAMTKCAPMGGAMNTGKAYFEGSMFDPDNRINFYVDRLKPKVLQLWIGSRLSPADDPLPPIE